MPTPLISTPEPVPFPWLGDLLIAVRKQQGITQTELAERIGSHQAAIARWEGGKYRLAEIETILTIAHALGLELLVTAVPRKADPLKT
ncbi:helix-turn-helix domain-containing protein [Armatimonas rosea]|uniref:Transcriptional regulator with XRE-family HTH domain n=1 Tax=Armatimonas rosea TaxID=685828 RepID=A0A7W9SX08_ARMRO|nr:helix-turn-helix transcriptional regulator [Armatimonas rosea]MBB6053935.1 transcriptional regulator with XRE-family HTH domain [Armatimonas rosea]